MGSVVALVLFKLDNRDIICNKVSLYVLAINRTLQQLYVRVLLNGWGNCRTLILLTVLPAMIVP